MGLGNTNSQSPTTSMNPTGTPAELEAMGHDLGAVRSCAVPSVNASGIPILLGCPRAADCAKFFRNKRIGDFGPKSLASGTPGAGPANVPYSLETAEGDYFESYAPCFSFFGGVYGRMIASRNPMLNTGEKIHILGLEGEAEIMVTTTLPQSPGSLTNMTLVTTTSVDKVPKFKRPHEVDPTWKMRRARQIADADEALDDMLGESAAGALDAGEAGEEEVTAGAIPVRRKPGRPRKVSDNE